MVLLYCIVMNYPTQFDKLEMYYEHAALFQRSKPIARIHRPRAKKQTIFTSRRDAWLNR